MDEQAADGVSISQGGEYDAVLRGEIDVRNATRVKATLLQAFELCERQPFVIQAAGVTFMDSTGLGALIAVANRARECSRQVVLSAPSARLRALIDMTGLAEVLPVAETDS